MSSDKRIGGNYVKAFITDKKPLDTDQKHDLEKLINRREGEAIFVFDFKSNRSIYLKGFSDYLGMEDSELDLLKLNAMYASPFEEFTSEYHDKLLHHLFMQNKKLESFESRFIMKIKNFESPILTRIKVFETDDNGNLQSIIGRSFPFPGLKTSDVVQYSIKGDFDKDFFNDINHNLNFKQCVSEKMIAIIDGINKNKKLVTIARSIGYTVVEITETIEKFKKNFNLNNSAEIIKFAYDNYLLPNQFKLKLKN